MQDVIKDIAAKLSGFEGEPTRSGVTAGEAEQGRKFQILMEQCLCRFFDWLIMSERKFQILPLRVYGSSIPKRMKDFIGVINANNHKVLLYGPVKCDNHYDLKLMTNLRNLYVSEDELAYRYDSHLIYKKYLSNDPPMMHRSEKLCKGVDTRFDGLFLLLTVKKRRGHEEVYEIDYSKGSKHILVELKSAKSSHKARIDGNAHERFSFQFLQYFLIANERKNLSLWLMTNSAYLKYKNKYYVGFQLHAEVIKSKFGSISFRMISSKEDYEKAFTELERWLISNSNS